MYGLKKILDVKQLKAADQHAIDQGAISSIDLMEQASNAFVEAILKKELSNKKIAVLCGIGNNGGDGLAVARILKEKGFDVQVFLIKFKEQLSANCAINLARIPKVTTILPGESLPDLSAFDLLIDAILGSGLTKKINGFLETLVASINQSGKPIFSIDIPSGLACDELLSDAIAIKADYCVSFQRPKRAFFYLENNEYLKEWTVVPIGLDENFIQSQETSSFILDQAIALQVHLRMKYSHKGTYGHALLIAGSYGKMGAAVLAAKACLRSGVGLLSVYIPKCAYQILQIAAPESMCLTDPEEDFISEAPLLDNFNAIGVGPGIGTSLRTANAFFSILKDAKKGFVIDADGINLLSREPSLLAHLPKNCILTPHLKEFERLVGPAINTVDRLEKQVSFSKKHHCIVVLKGANTSVSSPEGKLFFNTSGNPGMATGGSGDVLTGIITGLLAQNYDPLQAALIAVYFHGKAGDDAAIAKGQNGLVATDIIEYLRIENLK